MKYRAVCCVLRLTISLVVVVCGSSLARSADLVRVKRTDGTESQIFQKLITVRDINKVHEQPNDSSKVTRIGPYNVFFHVKTDSGDVQQNGFYRVVEDPKDRSDASKCRWIKPEAVQVWATRFAIKPTQVNKETTFQVDLSAGGKAVYDPEVIPEDATAYSFILEGGDGAEEENGPFKVALCVARAEDKGTAASLNQIGEMSLEICFVLEDEDFLQTDYKGDGKKFYEYVHALGESWAKKIKELSAAGKVPVKLGLVIFSDNHSKSVSKKPRVVVPLTSNIDQWVAGLKNVVGQKIGGDYQNDGLSGIAEAIGGNGWSENSAKHVVFMGNAPFQRLKGRGGDSDLPIKHYLNWLFDRNDPLNIWDKPGEWEDQFGVNTSGKLAEGIIAEAYRMGGQKGDELRRWKHLHCIHIGQTIEQIYKPEELRKIREFNAKTDEILRPLPPGEQIGIILKVGENLGIDALGYSIRAWMVEAFDKYDLRAQEEMRGLAQSQTYQGYYTHMNPEASEVDRVTRELGEKIEAAIKVIADVATGKEEQAMANKAQSENELTRPIFRIVGGKLSQGDVIKTPVQVGKAALRDSRSGRAVGEKVVMVAEDELRQLDSTLDAMYKTFESKRKAADRQNTKQVLDGLQASLATAASGQEIAADTQLQSVITDLPLRTEALRLTAGDIAVMSTNAFDAWLGDVRLAQNQIADLLKGDQSRWLTINGLAAAKTKYGFLRLSELP
jgi:hypothetical protein